MLSDRIENMKESATLMMDRKARELRSQGREVISLSLGEPDFDTPEHIKQSAWEALQQGYTKYTPVPGLPVLREAICEKFQRDNGLSYEPDQIVVSNGAKQCIANVCLSLLNPGDEVILFTPYWVSYYEIIKLAGAVPVCVTAGIEDDFKVSPEQLEEAITDKSKLIIFSSPCNPTGSVYTAEEYKDLAEVIDRHDGLYVLSDEIYEYINFTDTHVSFASTSGMTDRTITVNGFSKGFAMTGWRLGYMAADKSIAGACSKMQGQFTSGAASFTQMAGAHALRADLTETLKMRTVFFDRKELVQKLLETIPALEVNDPKGAFYIFPDCSSYFGRSFEDHQIDNADDLCMYLLKEAGVALVSGSAFGDDNCFRISYATSEDQLKRAIGRIGEALAKLE